MYFLFLFTHESYRNFLHQPMTISISRSSSQIVPLSCCSPHQCQRDEIVKTTSNVGDTVQVALELGKVSKGRKPFGVTAFYSLVKDPRQMFFNVLDRLGYEVLKMIYFYKNLGLV